MPVAMELNQRQSPLLRLPGELRNKIYEYALSVSKVVCRPTTTCTGEIKYYLYPVVSSRYTSPWELNEMKYTCRQLYQETRGLGLAWNTIKFPHLRRDIDPASSQCAKFLECCSPARRASIRTIQVWERPSKKSRRSTRAFLFTTEDQFTLFDLCAIGRLATFCQHLPSLAITVHLQEFSGCVDWYYYIIPGCLIETIVHKNPSPISSLSPANGRFVTLNDVAIASYVRKFAAVWEGFDMKAPPLPDNLKFFPAFNPDSGDRIDSEIPQFWKDFARKWWKNGF